MTNPEHIFPIKIGLQNGALWLCLLHACCQESTKPGTFGAGNTYLHKTDEGWPLFGVNHNLMVLQIVD
jgi:hypothetical protein